MRWPRARPQRQIQILFRHVEVRCGSKAEVTPSNSDVCFTSPKPTLPDAMSWLAASAAYIWVMRRVRKKKERTWEIRRLKASPAVFIGLVDAPDEAKAKELAIKQFDIRKEDRDRLLVRRYG
jgi:hypothetical protein